MTPPSNDRLPVQRARADQLRDAIAARAVRLRRDAVQLASGVARAPAGIRSVRRVPSWAFAAAAGALAGLLTALQRRRPSKP